MPEQPEDTIGVADWRYATGAEAAASVPEAGTRPQQIEEPPPIPAAQRATGPDPWPALLSAELGGPIPAAPRETGPDPTVSATVITLIEHIDELRSRVGTLEENIQFVCGVMRQYVDMDERLAALEENSCRTLAPGP